MSYQTEVGKDTRISIILDSATPIAGGPPSFQELQVSPNACVQCCQTGQATQIHAGLRLTSRISQDCAITCARSACGQ
jgi:hypothetical protein